MEEVQQVIETDNLLRRVICADPNYIRDDMTATSLAFKLRKRINETFLSVEIERLTTYEQSIGDNSRYRLFTLTADQVRSVGCDCIHMPEPENYAHAGITGNITNSISSQLAKLAVYINFPPITR